MLVNFKIVFSLKIFILLNITSEILSTDNPTYIQLATLRAIAAWYPWFIVKKINLDI